MPELDRDTTIRCRQGGGLTLLSEADVPNKISTPAINSPAMILTMPNGSTTCPWTCGRWRPEGTARRRPSGSYVTSTFMRTTRMTMASLRSFGCILFFTGVTDRTDIADYWPISVENLKLKFEIFKVKMKHIKTVQFQGFKLI